MREFESDSIDLIATDPPFNSGRHNIIDQEADTHT